MKKITKAMILREFADKVEEVWNEGEDGWWVSLKSGWEWAANTQEHCIHEDSLAECYEILRRGEPKKCDCSECQEYWVEQLMKENTRPYIYEPKDGSAATFVKAAWVKKQIADKFNRQDLTWEYLLNTGGVELMFGHIRLGIDPMQAKKLRKLNKKMENVLLCSEDNHA